LGTVYKRRLLSRERSFVQCKYFADKGKEEFFRCIALFGVKNYEFLKIHGVSARTRGEGGQFFAILSGCFYGWPLISLIFSTEFAACSKPTSRNNHRKAPYPRTQQHVRWGCELNLNHVTIVITRLL